MKMKITYVEVVAEVVVMHHPYQGDRLRMAAMVAMACRLLPIPAPPPCHNKGAAVAVAVDLAAVAGY